MWAIKSSGDNGMSVSVSIFICPFFVFFFLHAVKHPIDPRVILPLYQRQLKGVATVEP